MLRDASPATLYAFVAGLTVFGIVLGTFYISTLRRQSYERWPWFFRWPYYAGFCYLVLSGGVLLTLLYLRRLGFPI